MYSTTEETIEDGKAAWRSTLTLLWRAVALFHQESESNCREWLGAISSSRAWMETRLKGRTQRRSGPCLAMHRPKEESKKE